VTDRYQQIDFIIDYVKPRSIVEIGTWNGDRALAMASAALKHQNHLQYWGFDLFEDGSAKTDEEELNVKQHYSLDAVTDKLRYFQNDNSGFSFDLIRGNTRETLANTDPNVTVCDLAFIDGGHSVETIDSDYQALNRCQTVLFDDYYVPDENGACPDVKKFGCNELVETMPHWVLPVSDGIVSGGLVQMVLTGKLAQEFIDKA
tara:strand:- start:2994 stop:3602 length:609 start_codon:yes stop_codon:yes gene_type:complete